jgi:membrane protein DedA with SNARE-associated domain
MILKILSVIGLSSFEIYVALALAAGVGLTLWQTLICTMIGGVVGAFISLFLGQKIENWINTYLRKNKEPKQRKAYYFISGISMASGD